MKVAIVCGICDKPKRYSDSYAIKLTRYLKSESFSDGATPSSKPVTQKIRACRACTKRMGYKIKKVTKPVKKGGEES